MKKKLLTIALAALCPFFTVKAQHIKSLNIGDSIPESLWNMPLQVVNHPEGKDTITLNDYRGKLIILDFWATWCTNCVASMPGTHDIQLKFTNDVAVIPIAKDKANTVVPFLKRNEMLKNLNICSVVSYNDAVKSYFPHRLIPHIVWIGRNGTYLGATTPDQITENNISEALESTGLHVRNKLDWDTERPLFLSREFSGDLELHHYSIFFKGYYPGLTTGNKFRRKQNIVYGRAITNTVLLQFYEIAIAPVFREYSRKRVILEGVDSSEVLMVRDNHMRWKLDNRYNYEIVVPPDKADSLYAFMLSDLNHYSGYRAATEMRKSKCLVLTRIGKINQIKTTGAPPENNLFSDNPGIINQPLNLFIERIDMDSGIPLPLVDETAYQGNVDIQVPKSALKSQDTLRAALKNYGLSLIEAERPLRMLVIKKDR
ncbi:AhpC/TSA family protein [Arcticibacter tournemirensis]|uniref:TlpA family protein disulfide reductase n=1 Tax=Arcticibacter tournemirensis TaxID=699437 RepID=A0A5M9GM43_9SPHI|nr:TlpA disulfide reductase family protein [Arcticibacter tournemirensis]KAA8474825.1 TlpA family protein disulfide reductase [Arcticibacter tournemirensis]TQM49650.1 AhpC/TSA family protein [Arcticibacter tournemirensis]